MNIGDLNRPDYFSRIGISCNLFVNVIDIGVVPDKFRFSIKPLFDENLNVLLDDLWGFANMEDFIANSGDR